MVVQFDNMFSILISFEFGGDKAGYGYRDWFAMSKDMTLVGGNMTSLGLYK